MAGVPDGLERLWTPHRLAYVSGETVPASAKADGATPEGCPFCRIQRGSDEDGLVIARGGSVFAVLNLYPYNPGHLMVLPYRHVADYPDLSPAETVELAEFSQTAMRVVRRVSSPHGFNLGMNQGAIAGAGIAAHLHQHVVPRWGGDTNFMPVIARTKTVPQLLGDTRRLLAEAWALMARPSGETAPARPSGGAAPARKSDGDVPGRSSDGDIPGRSSDGDIPGRPSRRRTPATAAARSATPKPAPARPRSAATKSAAGNNTAAKSAPAQPAAARSRAANGAAAKPTPAATAKSAARSASTNSGARQPAAATRTPTRSPRTRTPQ